MSAARAVRVAIIADTEYQQDLLEQILKEYGYVVVLKESPVNLDDNALAQCRTDIWLVDWALGGDFPILDRLLATSELPVLYGEGNAPARNADLYPMWEKRFLTKLKQLVGDRGASIADDLAAIPEPSSRALPLPEELAAAQISPQEGAPWVWLLAGSKGAPGAVRSFLDWLPKDVPLGFLYAQHMQPGQEQQLVEALGRDEGWKVALPQDGQLVHAGEVLVVPTGHQISFDKSKHLQETSSPWLEPFSPSFDQIILNMAQRFSANFGIIVFSGVGHDGSEAIPYALRKGAQVWTQRPDTCTAPFLPQSLIDAGYSGFSGDPRELAAALIEHLAAQRR